MKSLAEALYAIALYRVQSVLGLLPGWLQGRPALTLEAR